MMKKILCIALLLVIIGLMGCGGPATSQGHDDISFEQSKDLSESSTEECSNDTSCESSMAEAVSDNSSDDNSDVSSDTSEIYSEVEIGFTEFE